MMDIAVGMAYDGKIPFVYSITPFLIYRPFETLRTYIDFENLPVKLIGAGRNDDYKHDGVSHDATDVGLYLNNLQNIQQYWPHHKQEIPDMLDEIVNNNKPSFISLTRSPNA
jgi:transketolase